MLYPSINELLEKIESRYALAMVVSKRARQIVDREKTEEYKEKTDYNKPVTIALHEVSEGKIKYSQAERRE